MRKTLWALSAFFLALVCFVAINLCVRIRHANERSLIADRIRDLGGIVRYDFDMIQPPPEKGMLWQIFGDDFIGRIVEVNISHRPIRDVDLQVLEQVPTMTRLTLYDTDVTDDGLLTIGALTQLEFLCVGNSRITDRGVSYLTELVNLRELILPYNARIGDQAATCVARLPKVTAVSLAGDRISAEGVEALGTSNLTWLYLANAKVDDDCIPAFIANDTLQFLDVSGTEMSPSGTTKLVTALPNCDVRW